ncbi:hypothetical protein DFR70_12624 [Nocardia tenerifensis]|uniref:Uncharacterized protein n=1 Tax=Nocardia tenerifensis TaxID=228006 RepID=A0A318JT40_9NOCA|nr:GAF domain-containing protein [Nocardia tenerifensis]PXX53903.1 hypothetical protein DFR70_12624 [Nocardia tenerifensis]
MAKAGWILVETLEQSRATVVARDNEPRARTSFERAVQDQVGGGRAPGSEAAHWLETIIEQVREQATPITDAHTLRNGREIGVRAIPVLGANRNVHGVHLWLGAPGATPPGPPLSAFGFTWNSQLRTLSMPPALSAGTTRSTMTAPELFRFVEPEDNLGLIKALLAPRPGADWQGPVTMHIRRQRVPAYVVLVAGPSGDEHCWQGILFETSVVDAARTESLEAAALAAIPRMVQVHMALVDVAKMRLIRWITDPMSDVQWKGQVDQRDTPHPDDVKRIFAAAAQVFNGTVDSAVVEGIRLRRRGGGWVVADSSGALMRTSDDGPLLGVVEFRVTGYSDEPDPVPPTDYGHPGLDDPNYPGGPIA